MHRHVTHNRCYAIYNDFCRSVLHFLRQEVPKNWATFCDSVTDNFRVINPADFRILCFSIKYCLSAYSHPRASGPEEGVFYGLSFIFWLGDPDIAGGDEARVCA